MESDLFALGAAVTAWVASRLALCGSLAISANAAKAYDAPKKLMELVDARVPVGKLIASRRLVLDRAAECASVGLRRPVPNAVGSILCLVLRAAFTAC